MTIEAFIVERRDEILALCLNRARSLPAAKGLNQEELADSLPGVLSALGTLLREEDRAPLEKLIHAHVSNRFRQGFGVEELVNELSVIGPCILQAWITSHEGSLPHVAEVAAVFEALHYATARSVAIFTQHLLEDEHTEKKYSRLLDRVASESFVEGAGPVGDRLDEILRVVVEAMGGDAAWLLLAVPETSLLQVKASAGALPASMLRSSATLGEDSLAGQAAIRNEPLVVGDIEQSALEVGQALRDSRIRAVIGARVWAANQLQGVLLVGANEANRFGSRHAWRIETFAGRLALLVAHARIWDALRQQSELVRRSEERLRLATEAAELGIWEFAPSTRKFIWDDRSRAFWGLPPEAQITYEVFISGIHPDDRARIREAVSEAIGRQRPFLEEYRTIGIGDGVERWISSHGKPSFDRAGNVDRYLGVMREITDAKRIDELRARLFGIVGHDLRNPLSAIKMAASSLARGAALPQTRLATTIGRAADRMNRMIHDLLDFTRVQFAAGVGLALEPADLGVVCRNVLDEIEIANPGRAVRLNTSGDCSGIWDASRISEALSNLVGNAIQYGEEGTPIEVTVHGEDAEVVLEVHNEGPPVPGELASSLFEAFRAKGPNSGLGLGLYISREIILAHHGKIEVRSSREAGTTFFVRLPRWLEVAHATH